MHPMMSRSLRAAVAAALGLLIAAAPASAVEFAKSLEGQVVWGGKELPKLEKIDTSKEPKCGAVPNQAYVINPKNKGVQWCLVWLVDADKNSYDKPIPINRRLKKPKVKQVVVDQPHCAFEPRVVGVWAPEQSVLIKNSAKFPHNTHLIYGEFQKNPILPPGGELEVKTDDLKPRAIPMLVTCDIHGWMKGMVGIFANPYFAVTDKDGKFNIPYPPAGKYRLFIYQETTGWVLPGGSPRRDGGKVIDIKADVVNDLGKIECKPAKD